jgi:bifunctional non-homologous end joining protein LigD
LRRVEESEPVISHPEKLLFPSDGISKGDVAAYYEAVAEVMLPHLRGRPVTMERFPAGIEAKGFMQKDVVKGFPEWLERVEVPKKGGTVHYPLVGDLRSLLWLANQNCITPHVWTSRVPELFRPDLCVFDLDPAQDEPQVLRAAALGVRDLLTELGLPSWLKTSGSKGFHIVTPLDDSASFDQVWHFAHGVAAVLVKRDPEHLTQEFSKADRAGRILIDTGRNGYNATVAAAYAVRPKPGAPVSAPCTWSELEQATVAPQTFNVRNMTERLAAAGDVWADLHTQAQPLAPAVEQLQAMLSTGDWDEALAASTRRPKARAAAAPRKKS